MAYFKDDKGQREAPTECLSPLGAIALADAIPDMGALTKLDISNNYIRREHQQLITEVCDTKGIELDNHESEIESSDGDY